MKCHPQVLTPVLGAWLLVLLQISLFLVKGCVNSVVNCELCILTTFQAMEVLSIFNMSHFFCSLHLFATKLAQSIFFLV